MGSVVVVAAVIVATLARSALGGGPALERIHVVGNPASAVRLELSAPATVEARTLPVEGDAPDRIYLDIAGAILAPGAPRVTQGAGPLLRVRAGQYDPATTRVVLDLAGPVAFTLQKGERTITVLFHPDPASALRPGMPDPTPTAQVPPDVPARAAGPPVIFDRPFPPQVVFDRPLPPPLVFDHPEPPPVIADHPLPALVIVDRPLPPASAPTAVASTPAPSRATPPQPARPTRQQPSVSRPKGPVLVHPLIVLDAGHGGRDPGAEGVGGILEKDVVLEVAQLVARRLAARLPVDVLMTRTDDSFIPIEHRVPGENAALFISLHANACIDPRARGLEIFYGGGRVRSASTPGHDWRAALLGRCLDQALQARIGGVRGEPRPGPFGVLVRNPAPSALIEIGYLTHPDEAARAQDRAYHGLLADAIVDGVTAFLRASAPPL